MGAPRFGWRRFLLNSITSILVLTFLLLETMAAGALMSALRGAVEGFEDEFGFHRVVVPSDFMMG
jgi:hypothetical protein